MEAADSSAILVVPSSTNTRVAAGAEIIPQSAFDDINTAGRRVVNDGDLDDEEDADSRDGEEEEDEEETREDIDDDDVDTDEDIESQVKPDFAPLDSRRSASTDRDPESSRGLGAHAALRRNHVHQLVNQTEEEEEEDVEEDASSESSDRQDGCDSENGGVRRMTGSRSAAAAYRRSSGQLDVVE